MNSDPSEYYTVLHQNFTHEKKRKEKKNEKDRER